MSAEDNPAAQPAEIGEALVAALGFEPTEGTKLGRKAGSSTSIADELSEAENPTVEDANDAPPVDDAFSVVAADASADDGDVTATNGNSGSGSSSSSSRGGAKSGSAKKTNSSRQRSRSEKSRARNRSSSRTRNSSAAATATETKPSIDEIKSLAKPTVSEAEVAADDGTELAASESGTVAATAVVDAAEAAEVSAGISVDEVSIEAAEVSADDAAVDGDAAGVDGDAAEADDAEDPVAKAKAETEAIRKRLAEAKRKAGIVEDDSDTTADSDDAASNKKSGSDKSGAGADDTAADDSAVTTNAEAGTKKGGAKAEAKKADADPGSASGDRSAKSGATAKRKAPATTIVETKGGGKDNVGAGTKSGAESKPAAKSGGGAEAKSGGASSSAKAKAAGSEAKSAGDGTAAKAKSGSAKSGSTKGGSPKDTSKIATGSAAKAKSSGEVTARVEAQPPPPSAGDAIQVAGSGLSAAAVAAAAPAVDEAIPTSPPSMESVAAKTDSVPEARLAPETLDREPAFPTASPFDTPQAKPSVGRELSRPTMPELPFRNPFRRKRRVQARKVRRVVRHIDPWSVLTFSVLFHLCVFAALLLASVLVWNAAEAAGTIENIETFITDLGDYERFVIEGEVVFKAAVAIAGILTLASSVLLVLLTVVFNLISDLVGGIRLTVIEEETVRVRRRKTRS